MAQLMNAEAYMTLAGALDELARRGFTARFQVFDGGLRAAGGEETMRPKDLVIREYYRFEGISDPDDMAILYALKTKSGVRGTLADAYGTYSDPSVGAFMDDVAIFGRTVG